VYEGVVPAVAERVVLHKLVLMHAPFAPLRPSNPRPLRTPAARANVTRNGKLAQRRTCASGRTSG
ncbi:unnamed protein product, partial [Closterium sp. Naga37s-1]